MQEQEREQRMLHQQQQLARQQAAAEPLGAAERAAAKTMQHAAGGAPPPDGAQLTDQAFGAGEEDRQLEVAASTFNPPMVPTRVGLRRLGEARGREGRILERMSQIKPGQAQRRRLRQKLDYPITRRPTIKYSPAIPVQMTGANPEGKMSILPMDALPKVDPYYDSTTPAPSKAPTKAPSKAPTQAPTQAPTLENPLEQFKGAFGRKEGRDVEEEMKSKGELRRLRGKRN